MHPKDLCAVPSGSQGHSNGASHAVLRLLSARNRPNKALTGRAQQNGTPQAVKHRKTVQKCQIMLLCFSKPYAGIDNNILPQYAL